MHFQRPVLLVRHHKTTFMKQLVGDNVYTHTHDFPLKEWKSNLGNHAHLLPFPIACGKVLLPIPSTPNLCLCVLFVVIKLKMVIYLYVVVKDLTHQRKLHIELLIMFKVHTDYKDVIGQVGLHASMRLLSALAFPGPMNGCWKKVQVSSTAHLLVRTKCMYTGK